MAELAPACWHVISSDELLDLLRRVSEGEDPELVYLTLYANAEHRERPE